ncbi:ATP-binding protein [Thauera sinica]|uniref:ATP-binding protein n=1 Tax=Thauera sinica TaxID=2665146 RepID=A0ABW1AXV8_9RHOO|nr:ATP-binding protein [Thauera sp. K11]ATE58749.1 ATP-binding protein [Thauera sp. K11]
MSLIRLKTNQHRLIANLRHAFTPHSMLGELLQNARRAKASHIHVIADGNTLIVSDDGIGIADLQSLIHIAESGWDPALQARENAFGLGVLSTLYFAERLSVHSGSQSFRASTAAIIRGDDIEVRHAPPLTGTEIRLDGVQSPQAGLGLSEWIGQRLERLCEAFPVRVSFNGTELARPLADASLPWRDTPMGRVLLDLSSSPKHWRCFLQGLPIGRVPTFDPSAYQVILLRDDIIARLPDRQYLLNEEDDHRRIQAAIDGAYRQALIEAKESLSGREFVELYAETCLSSSNADLLNDIPFALCEWFRNWEGNPPGYYRYREWYPLDGIATRAALQEVGVWCIESDRDDEPTAEVYLQARQTFLLEEPRLHAAHWLMHLARTLTPDQVRVRHGPILHTEDWPELAERLAELVLVETLGVSLEGERDAYPVVAVRKGDTLYLTPAADADDATRLICDYVFDECYREERKDEDAQTLTSVCSMPTVF